MTHTIVASAKREVVIGFDRPFCIIGERINPTGRKKLAAEMVAGNFETVKADALAQVAAGAHILDVNAGVTAVNPNESEPPLMRQTIEIVQSLVDIPLCIDSSVPAALKAGLETARGRPLVNSVTGEEDRLEAILPLVAKYNVPVVAISNDETGISEDPDVRFEVARKIVNRAADHGIRPEDVVVDPLVMPIGAMGSAGQQVFRLVRRLREELKVNTTCGASNISFGMPNRRALTGYFLAMAASHGMTSAIMNPLHDEDMHAIMGANVLNGVDANCLAWIRKFREPAPAAAADGAPPGGESESDVRRREREERRRRRG
jgi:5-methyltetrahydrofolate--homocysteine methyltransferase